MEDLLTATIPAWMGLVQLAIGLAFGLWIRS